MIANVSKGISKDLINASYTLRSNRRDAVLSIIAPTSVPGVLDTLRVTMGWAWTYLVVAELVAASSGLGYLSLKAMRGFSGRRDFPRHRDASACWGWSPINSSVFSA